MEYWVDGYNLILRKGWDREGTLEQARGRLLRAAVLLGVPVRVYFDARRGAAGPSEREESPAARVRPLYVREGAADDALAADLRAAATAAEVAVVTDDRELRGRVKSLGGRTLGVDKFLERLEVAGAPARPGRRPPAASDRKSGAAASGPRDVRLSTKEVDAWLKTFGIEGDVALDPRGLDRLDGLDGQNAPSMPSAPPTTPSAGK